MRLRGPLTALLALALALLAHAAVSRAAGPCDLAPAPGDSGVHLQYGGHLRFYVVHVPPGVQAGTRVPLVVVLHGAGGSGTQMERYSGFSRVADQHRFAVAFPSAASPVWNITADRRQADDVGFIARVIDTVEDSVCVDPARVFATGVSNGAGMTALLGCRLGARLAAIAPVEGIYDDGPACRPPAPLSVLEIHGTADTIAPYYGRREAASAAGVPAYVRSWVHRDGCTTAARTSRLAYRATLYRWSRCAGGVTVQHVRVQGGAHQWPGATPADPGPPSTFCGACVIWGFFASLQPPPASATGGASLSGSSA